MFVIAEKLLLFKENGCEERSAAGEVHERVMSSNERCCRPQRSLEMQENPFFSGRSYRCDILAECT